MRLDEDDLRNSAGMKCGGHERMRPSLHVQLAVAATVIRERSTMTAVTERKHPPNGDDVITGVDLFMHEAVDPCQGVVEDRAPGRTAVPVHSGELVTLPGKLAAQTLMVVTEDIHAVMAGGGDLGDRKSVV